MLSELVRRITTFVKNKFSPAYQEKCMAHTLYDMYACYERYKRVMVSIQSYQPLREATGKLGEPSVGMIETYLAECYSIVNMELTALDYALTVYNQLVFNYRKSWPRRTLPPDVVIEPMVKETIENFRRGREDQRLQMERIELDKQAREEQASKKTL